MIAKALRCSGRYWLLVVTLFVLAGCKTTPPIDWNTRVGTYTYDQAVIDLGPPDKTAKLSDGTTVAEWVVGRKRSPSFSLGTGVYGGHGGVSVGQTVGGGGSLRVLRLVFDGQNVLQNWSRT